MRVCFLAVCWLLLYNADIYGQAPTPIRVSRDTLQRPLPQDLAKRVQIRLINFNGNARTRTRVLLREMSVSPGDSIDAIFLADVLKMNRNRLFNLSIFTEVVVNADRVTQDVIDLNVYVKERWNILPEVSFALADRNINVWWNEQNHDLRRANIGLTLRHKNFRGNLENLSATAQVGYTQKFSIDYYRPYIDKAQQHGIGASFFASKNEETFYKTDSNKLRFVRTQGAYIIRQFEGTLLYAYRPAYTTRHLFELRYRDYEVDDTIVKLNPNYYENGSTRLQSIELTYRFDMNEVDNWNYPLYGNKLVAYSTTRFGISGMRFQQMLQVEAGKFYHIGGRFYGSEVFRGRLSLPEDQPYALRAAMGNKSEYVRGYEYYVIDGAHYGLLRSNLKFEALNTTIRNIPLRYLPSIPLRLYPKIFADVGYGHNRYPGNSFLHDRWLYSAGIGFDILSAYDLKLRVEYTINHLGQKDVFLHVESE